MRARSGGSLKAAAMVLVALVVAVSLLALLAAESADAAGRYKTVTKTFSNSSAITINDLSVVTPYPSEINAGGFKKGKIRDVNLTLKNFSHTWPHDVDVMLEHRGQNRTVMSDVGGNFDVNNITLVLDDEAAGFMHQVNQLAGGRYKPTDGDGSVDPFPAPAPSPSGAVELSGFDGLNPSGPWTLWVVDDGPGDAGQFAGGWSITIKARVLR